MDSLLKAPVELGGKNIFDRFEALKTFIEKEIKEIEAETDGCVVMDNASGNLCALIIINSNSFFDTWHNFKTEDGVKLSRENSVNVFKDIMQKTCSYQ